MAPPRLTPSREMLVKYREQGLTLQQIVETHHRDTGLRTTVNAVAKELSRMGNTTPRPRYDDALPWTVPDEHTQAYEAQMLRLLARRKRGWPLAASPKHEKKQAQRLDKWLKDLEESNCVVWYSKARGFEPVAKETVPAELLDPDYPILRSLT